MAKARPGLDGELYRHVGSQIRQSRLAAKLRQEQLATRVGVSRASIANIEAGKQALSLHSLVAIARALDATVEGLLPQGGAGQREHVAIEAPDAVREFMRELAGA